MDLYQQLILDHSKNPRHAGLREPFQSEAHHVNPTCGDEITVRVAIAGEGEHARLADISYQATGCSISVASASVMAQEITDTELVHAREVHAAMKAMLTSRGTDPGEEEVIGDGVALAGVSQYPARVKCALLPWAALTDALARQGIALSG